MNTAAQQFLALAGLAVGLFLALVALTGSRKAWHRDHNPTDLALSLVAALWLLHLVASTALSVAADYFGSNPSLRAYSDYSAHVGYQTLMVGVLFFLLACAGVASAGMYLLVLLQAVAGAATLHWHLLPSWQQGLLVNPWADAAQTPAYQAWIAINLLSALVVVGAIARRLYLTGSYNCWLALAAGVMGLGLFLDDILLADQAKLFAPLLHCFYATFLLMVSRLVTQPAWQIAAQSAFTRDFQQSSGFEAITGFGLDHALAASAVAHERKRIAQDLHDGVGSQIVNILSSMDGRAPQQQAVVLALEQCLVDLKMTVDAIDCTNDNVLEALGRLRYRVQHSLDKLGISMGWKVEICTAFEAVRGAQAEQALRIAQESLANVMRHAHASAVEVVCRFLADSNEMVLEVRDNGQGIARNPEGRPTGKGLEGMRRRAHEAGGELLVFSKTGGGTCVRLTLPLAEKRVWTLPFGPRASTSAVWQRV